MSSSAAKAAGVELTCSEYQTDLFRAEVALQLLHEKSWNDSRQCVQRGSARGKTT